MSKDDGRCARNQPYESRSLSGPLEKNTRSGLRLSNNRRLSRCVALVVVGVLHLLVVVALRLELSRRDREPSQESAPALIVSFLDQVEPSPEEPAPSAPLQVTPKPPRQAKPAEQTRSAIQFPPSESTPKEPPRVDFQMELKRSAQTMIDRDEEKARQAAALGSRRDEVPESLRPKTPADSTFAWSYRAQPRDPLEVRLNERCSLIMGIVPVCKFGKIPVRGDLLAGMNKLKTPAELGVEHSHSIEPMGHETRRRLAEVSRLLGEWRAEHGSYPEDLAALVSIAPAAAPTTGPGVQIVDTWNQKLVYNRPPHAPPCDYDLYSVGPNGVDDHGQRDDIVTCGSTGDLSF